MPQNKSFQNYLTYVVIALIAALVLWLGKGQKQIKNYEPINGPDKIEQPQTDGGPSIPTRDEHLALGNPSNAKENDTQNLLLRKPQYVVSYNCMLNRANWVCWHLSRAWMGYTKRQNNFRPDPELPASCAKVVTQDYSRSGFDRGHLCPGGDRNSNEEDNAATFLLTNIVPQAPQLNRGSWEKLENYCRLLASEGNELYIIAGVYGEGGEGSEGARKKIGKQTKISVPARFFKIILILPNGENDLKRISKATRVIAADFPNKQLPENDNWENYQTSIEAIEEATGWQFFTALPAKVRAELKEKTKNQPLM
jgi:endonuclease G